ncbi:MAG: glycosyl hydrolase, partial [Lysobacterales bacterium]
MKNTITKTLLPIICLTAWAGAFAADSGTPITGAAYSTTGKTIRVFQTAMETDQRLALAGSFSFSPGVQPTESEVSVFVNPARRFQTFLGIGGSLTDASAEVFAKLPQDKQAELLRAYYDPEDGIAYSLARTTIHSADFSSESYTYIEEGDKELSTFSIEHDRQYRIPLIKRAIEA